MTIQWVMHCGHMGPHLGDRVPMGTFFSFGVPIGSPFLFQGPHCVYLRLKNAWKVHAVPLSIVDNKITFDNTTSTHESHANLSVKSVLLQNNVSRPLIRHYFNELACFDQFCKHALFGSPFCSRGSPLGPHFTENWVPIGYQFWKKWVPMACGHSG